MAMRRARRRYLSSNSSTAWTIRRRLRSAGSSPASSRASRALGCAAWRGRRTPARRPRAELPHQRGRQPLALDAVVQATEQACRTKRCAARRLAGECQSGRRYETVAPSAAAASRKRSRRRLTRNRRQPRFLPRSSLSVSVRARRVAAGARSRAGRRPRLPTAATARVGGVQAWEMDRKRPRGASVSERLTPGL